MRGKEGDSLKTTLSKYCERTGSDTLLREWDAERNDGKTPDTVTYGSHYKARWRCDRGHRWEAAVYARTAGSGCPICAGKHIQSGGNDLATRFPDLAAEWHPTKNAMLPPPSKLSPGSHRPAWWRCEKGHEWVAVIKSRTEGCGCPICANREVLAGYNDLATTHPQLASEWDTEKNGGLTPSGVLPGSSRRVWWRCAQGHSWRATVNSRANDACGCPMCAGKRTVSGENDLASGFPLIAEEWDAEKNGALTPADVTAQSNRRVWWRCWLGHSYAAAVSDRVKRGSGCPYCAGHRVLPGFNDLATKNPLLAAEWESELNGALTPETVTTGSRKKVWWQCRFGHVWRAAVFSRARDGCGCPVCAGRARKRTDSVYLDRVETRAAL